MQATICRFRLLKHHLLLPPTAAARRHLASSLPLPRHDLSSSTATARANLTITNLSSAGKISDARRLFDETPHRDVITWTALISGYIRCGMLREARLLFDRPDAAKNTVTYTALLSGYVRAKNISEAECLFHRIPNKNVITYNTMITGYAESDQLDNAWQLFNTMPERNTVSYNTMIKALTHSGRAEEAKQVFDGMPERDVITWTSMITGLSQNGRVDEARELFDRMPVRNVVSWNAMIAGYVQNLRLEEGYALFGRMPERDVASWNTMVTGFIQNGDLVRGRELFDRMRVRNVVSWTMMIMGYTQDGQDEIALNVFLEMRRSGVRPNQGTFVNILSAVSNLAALHEGRQIHQIVCKTTFQFAPFVQSALVSMYSKCGEIDLARKMFDLSEHKDLVSWNNMISSYAHHGSGKEALNLFEEMQRNGFKPDDVTYVGLLSACSHSGLVDEGIELFRSVVSDPSIEVREDHYACLVDLCGRAGRLAEGANFIKGLKVESPSADVWGALLGGSNVHGDMKIGELAAKKLLEVEPNDAGTFMSLINLYASQGRWKEAAMMRSKMKEKGLKKQPGCSWIHVDNAVHVFLVRDKSHNESKEIYGLVQDLHYLMTMEGYVPIVDDMLNVD